MAGEQSWPRGRRIWPDISSVGGDIDDDTQKEIRELVTQLAEYVANALERMGINRFAFPLFRPFNAVFDLTVQAVLVVHAPLVGGMAILRFMDRRKATGDVTLEEAAVIVQQELGWSNIAAFQLPADLLEEVAERRESRIRAIAESMAEDIKGAMQATTKRVTLQPIFQAQPEDLELDEKLCFVLMPFQPPFDRLYEEVLTPVVRDAGLEPLRADQIFSPTPIVEDICRHIATARIVIADVTGRNPNVFYELGLAHTAGKTVIILAQSGEDIPFDLAYIRYFTYRDDAGGWDKLRTDLRAAIEAVLDDQ